MPRPFKYRIIRGQPQSCYFKPQGIPMRMLEEVNLTMDEIEAMRLAFAENLYQEDAARKMNVSRQTFGNIINNAQKKITDALLNGKALKISGGIVQIFGASGQGPVGGFRRRGAGRGRFRGRGQV